MTLQDGYAQAMGSAFRERVGMAVARVATQVFQEPPATANHMDRLQLAISVARGPTPFIHSFAFLLASRGLRDTSTDAEIVNGVQQAWDLVAG